VSGALALLIIAGLFVRSLRSAQHSDLGFDPQKVLNVALDPGEIGYTQTQIAQFYDQLLARVRALPGVEWASLAMTVPLDNFPGDDITIQDMCRSVANNGTPTTTPCRRTISKP
jgi:putative ABC transport system permease protein